MPISSSRDISIAVANPQLLWGHRPLSASVITPSSRLSVHFYRQEAVLTVIDGCSGSKVSLSTSPPVLLFSTALPDAASRAVTVPVLFMVLVTAQPLFMEPLLLITEPATVVPVFPVTVPL
ncbi:hypothetical protein KCP71_08600 [Salmonella enterica subsp. enterica]|nr:hypothetical protein KCP71_08600 [Salmonella enterica subsp. enterica]